jgi:hypothetical protein
MGTVGVNEITLAATAPEAVKDLELVFDMIEGRRQRLNEQAREEGVPPAGVKYAGPAFVVHGPGLHVLLRDYPKGPVAGCVEHAARHGERCGVVFKFYGVKADVLRAVGAVSPTLARALGDGRVLQVVEPHQGGGQRFAAVPADDPRESGHFATLVCTPGAEADAGDFLAGMLAAGRAEDPAVAMAFLANELRRASDAIDPDGGMIPCPLCLTTHPYRPDEIATHLVTEHAGLAEGVRSQ